MRFYRRDVNSVKKMIGALEKYPHNEDSSFSLCRRAICGIYENECRNCMFSYANNIHGLACEDTVGVFDEMPISDIVKKLEFMYSQLYICELNSYKKFKSGG